MDEYLSIAKELAHENNVWSAQQAQKQMDFQERMSSTAHQREIADLKAAGLNPVLSANNGAASATGAMGSTDNSVVGILPQLMQFAESAVGSSSMSAAGLKSVSDSLNKVIGNKDFGVSKVGKKKSSYSSETLDKIKNIAGDLKSSLPYKYKWIAGAVESVADNADPELVDKFVDNPVAYCLSIMVPPGETRDKVYDCLVDTKRDMVSYFKNMIDNPKEFFYDESVPGILIGNAAKRKANAVAKAVENSVKSSGSSTHVSSTGRSHGSSSGTFTKSKIKSFSTSSGSAKRMAK